MTTETKQRLAALERLAAAHTEEHGPIDPLSASLLEFENELAALDDAGLTLLAAEMGLTQDEAVRMKSACISSRQFIF